MDTPNSFSINTGSTPIDNHQRAIELSALWNVGKIPNGGYLMAYAAKTMGHHINQPHPLSVSAYYLDRTEAGPAIIATEILREGKSISTLSGQLIQAGEEKIRLTAAFTDLSKTKGETFCTEHAPKITAWDSCLDVSKVAPMLKLYQQFEMRFDPACTGWNDGNFKDQCEINLWLSHKDKSPFDVYSLLMVPDVLPPSVFCRFGANGWVPTIEMTVNIRAIPTSHRLQLRAKTRYLTDGILEEDVEVWDEQGNILALSRQVAKLRIQSY